MFGWEVFIAQCWLLQYVKSLSAHFKCSGEPSFIKGVAPGNFNPLRSQFTIRKKIVALHFTTVPCEQTMPSGHMERFGLMVVDAILTALLISSLNGLQVFFVFLCSSCHLFPYGGFYPHCISFFLPVKTNYTVLTFC